MKVTLNEANHVYTDTEGIRYTPVSNVIAAYKNPFDAETIATNYAAKHGGTMEYWLKVWADGSSFASRKGTAFHNLKEDFVANSAFFKHDIALSPVFNWKLLRETKPGFSYEDLPVGTYTELTLADYVRKIAGTADLVTILPDKWVDIDDYKTNKELKKQSFANKKMKAPLQDIPDANYWHYMIQLNIYGYLLSLYGYKIRRLRILYYNMQPEHVESVLNGKACHDLEAEIHEVPYIGADAGKLLDHYCQYKRNNKLQTV